LFGPAAKYPFAPDSPYTSHDALPETFITLQDKLGLGRAVIVSPGGYGRNYQLLADTLARFPDRFRGIALMPEDTNAAEFARLTGLGVRGAAHDEREARPARSELFTRDRRTRGRARVARAVLPA
jgi:predicted TIM-barrel fold metal-dependent hydrolase